MIERVIRAVKLDATLYQEVDGDESKTSEALMVVVAASLIGGLLAAFKADGSIAGWVIGSAIGAPIFLAIWSGIVLLLGKMFGGEATYSGLIRTLGYAAAPSAASIVPVIGPVVALWGLATSVVAVRESHRLSTGQAVIVVVIPAIILLVLVVLLFAAIIAAVGLSAL